MGHQVALALNAIQAFIVLVIYGSRFGSLCSPLYDHAVAHSMAGLILAGSLTSPEANFTLKRYATLYGNSTDAPRDLMPLDSLSFDVRLLQLPLWLRSLAHAVAHTMTPRFGRWAIFVTFLLAAIHHGYVLARSRTHTDALALGQYVRSPSAHPLASL